jgi:hypothetical protein
MVHCAVSAGGPEMIVNRDRIMAFWRVAVLIGVTTLTACSQVAVVPAGTGPQAGSASAPNTASGPPVTPSTPAPAGAAGVATLTWTAPTQNTDGSALTNLAGYWVLHGTSPWTLSRLAQIADPAARTYQVTNLAPGAHYFALTAYTDAGAESEPSNVGSKTIP